MFLSFFVLTPHIRSCESLYQDFRIASELIGLKRQNANLKKPEKRFLFRYLILRSSSWKDYIDVTARYFRTSGLLAIHRLRINIPEPHREMVEWILFVFRKNWNC